tara:strand:- start:89 stop:310 length:222 start_codon:yes stop_codon:yes gene_type:complete
MATFTVRADERVEQALKEFMENEGHNTKAKAVEWLILNSLHLCNSTNILIEVTKAQHRIIEEKKIIAELLMTD